MPVWLPRHADAQHGGALQKPGPCRAWASAGRDRHRRDVRSVDICATAGAEFSVGDHTE